MLEFFYKKTRYGEEYLEEIAAIEDRNTQDIQNVQRYERLNEGGWELTGEALVKFVPSEWTVLPTEQFEVYEFYPKHSYDYGSFRHSDPYAPPKTDPEPTDPEPPVPVPPGPVPGPVPPLTTTKAEPEKTFPIAVVMGLAMGAFLAFH